MPITIAYDILRWEEKALIGKAREIGVDINILHLPNTVLDVGGTWQAPGSVALIRATSLYRALASASALESSGVRTVNTAGSLYSTSDKIRTHSLLERHGVPTPRTKVAFSLEAALSAAESIGYPVVVKPLHGSWGRLVALARDRESLRSIIEYSQHMGPQGRIHYLQEYIEKPGRDIRTFCVGNTVPAGIYRISSSWITNTARGARSEPVRIDNELEDLTLRACRAVEAEFAGVDIVEDRERGYLVLEVNGVPEFKNTVRVTGVDIPGIVLSYLNEISDANLPSHPYFYGRAPEYFSRKPQPLNLAHQHLQPPCRCEP
ncbi:MAG: lysine biosynthesis protein LysX [Desulfurococcales archaeon]|nr:lysine biosynthesis protein LysX [Desulfurococcales archaeon]